MSERVLVTGASGFIGAALARRLAADGETVHVLARTGSDLGDVADDVVVHRTDGGTDDVFRSVHDAAPDVVYHLAACGLSQHTPADVEPLVRANVLLTTQLLDAMARVGSRRFVTVGSAWQHYQSRSYGPTCLYAATKQAAEAVLQYYSETAGLRAVTLKLFHAYGPGDRRARLVALLTRAAATRQRLAMTAGRQVVDLVYIDDVVRALQRAAELLRSGEVQETRSFAVSSGRPLTVRDVVAAFAAVTGRPFDVAWGARPYKPRELMTPVSMGEPLPGWEPEVPLEEGLWRTWSTRHREEERSHVEA